MTDGRPGRKGRHGELADRDGSAIERGFGGGAGWTRLGGRIGLVRVFVWSRVIGVVFRILEPEELFEVGKIYLPAAGFVFGALLGLSDETGDVGEGSGAAIRDPIGGEGVKKLAEDVVDVNLGDVIAGRTAEVGGKVGFDGGLGFGFGGDVAEVGEAEAVAFGMGREAAEASIGEFVLAEIEDIGWSGVGHNGEGIAKKY